jgi:uncharacterized protein
MHYTLHLTDECNMACRYCYVRQNTHYMTLETAKAAVDLAAEAGGHSGIIFFGGEPLLCRELIYETVAYAEQAQKGKHARFHYKVTTNGLLLDDEFLRYSAAHEVFIALSHDGIREAHDLNRIRRDETGTFGQLEQTARDLLKYRPYAPVLMTVAPNTVAYYARSVKYLYELGFRYIICSIDYAGAWTDELLRMLKKQYKLLAAFYKELTLREEKFYLSPFEVKLSSHIRKDSYCAERCELGKKQLSVSPGGKLYPCVQFVGEEAYCIGDVRSGIDEAKRLRLYRLNEQERDTCVGCAVKGRCNHFCACLNKQATGDLRKVSPVLCAHERILLPIADTLAEDLYKKRSAIFIQKQYNDMFPLLSLMEDKAAKPQHMA